MAAHKDITILCGEPWDAQNFLLTFSIEGVLTDLTGSSAVLVVSSEWASRDQPLLLLSTADDSLILGGAAGTVAPSLTAAETAALWPTGFSGQADLNGQAFLDLGVYTLTLIDPAGRASRKLAGKFILSPEAARA